MQNENAAKKMAIGVDMGGTNIRLGIVRLSGEILERSRLKSEADQGPEAVISRLAEAIVEAREMADRAQGTVACVGIGIAGNVQPTTGMVVISPNLPGWRNINLKETLERRISMPVAIDNDANVMAMGEHWLGEGMPYTHFICLTLGTGVGGGLFLDGQLWRGYWGSGGEVGHMVLDPDGGPCNCGNKGCLESSASATAIIRKTLDALRRSEPSSLSAYLQCPEKLSALLVAEAARKGDRLALNIFEEVGSSLGMAIVNIMNLLGLEAFIIGGGVSAAWDLFYPALRRKIDLASKLFPPEVIRVIRAKLGEDGGILGAAKIAFNVMANDNLP
jgi:glucokinase